MLEECEEGKDGLEKEVAVRKRRKEEQGARGGSGKIQFLTPQATSLPIFNPKTVRQSVLRAGNNGAGMCLKLHRCRLHTRARG